MTQNKNFLIKKVYVLGTQKVQAHRLILLAVIQIQYTLPSSNCCLLEFVYNFLQ